MGAAGVAAEPARMLRLLTEAVFPVLTCCGSGACPAWGRGSEVVVTVSGSALLAAGDWLLHATILSIMVCLSPVLGNLMLTRNACSIGFEMLPSNSVGLLCGPCRAFMIALTLLIAAAASAPAALSALVRPLAPALTRSRAARDTPMMLLMAEILRGGRGWVFSSCLRLRRWAGAEGA